MISHASTVAGPDRVVEGISVGQRGPALFVVDLRGEQAAHLSG
jgi:hypothetical protein